MTTKTRRQQRPIALTMGDPSGIGLDITADVWNTRNVKKAPAFFLIADLDIILERLVQLDLDIPLKSVSSVDEVYTIFKKALPVLPVTVAGTGEAGKPSVEAAPGIIASIEMAVREVMQGNASSLVTNPISKAHLYTTGFPHPGHTEFLAALANKYEQFGVSPVMMMVCEELKVIPLTIHIPLSEVPNNISENLIVSVVETACRDLKKYFSIQSPRIAVSGINPHAGESGSLGSEEQRIIEPTISRLKQNGIDIVGPLSADTLFHDAVRSCYDVIITMYHDQALIPIKTIAFDNAVNVTLGLPFIRTSPDHGTAFDIAGTGKANSSSLLAALKLASQMANNRRSSAGE
ncbi:MAG: 4-hydroxythreonine-4-phosphate dehydrogenase PdxA [Desulfobulbia bacterium]